MNNIENNFLPSTIGGVDYSLPQQEFLTVLDEIVERHTSKLCSQSENLLRQNQILLGVMLQLKSENEKNLKHLQQLVLYQEQEELEKQEQKERRMRRKARQRKPPRDHIKMEHLWHILYKVSGKSYPDIRAFVCFVLLYITGLRSKNLSTFTVRHAVELTESGRTRLTIVKNGPANHPIVLSPESLQLWRLCETRIAILCEGKRKTDYVFTGLYKPASIPPSEDIVRRESRVT